ncbi:MAG: hypothetical protein U0835_10110 [Isosphaeraceae bacterium]
MVDRIARVHEEKPPPNRLEHWLARMLAGGGLRGLPRYHPLGCGVGQCAELYARTLLAALRASEGDGRRIERLKDDVRAFRSWAELPQAQVA